MPTLSELTTRLAAIGQQHLLSFYATLPEPEQRRLLAQVAALDLESLPALIDRYVLHRPPTDIPPGIEPAPYYPYSGSAGRADFKLKGEALIRAGKVAAFVVAGGQGSRLGFDGPKGCFPGGAVTQKTLFQIFAEGLLATRRRYNAPVPWYIMTSPLNHDATLSFFETQKFFGLPREDVMFFPQGVMPSFDIRTGKILLASHGEVATNPDGHGGCIRALDQSGALADMQRRGVEHLSYFQVDNPLVRVVDPVFLGLHASAPDSSAEMSSKMLPKVSAEEKVGVFCRAEGKTVVIEYSDLPKDLAGLRNPDGALKFNAGSIAIHILSVEFIAHLARDPAFALPFHRAEKKVPHVDPAGGRVVKPAENNAVKLEKFVFDALALCRASIVCETDRVEEFAPIKNATGDDSVESSRRIQTRRAARWLESVGVEIPRKDDATPDCTLEISPLTALEPDDLKNAPLPKRIERGVNVAL